MPENDFDGAAWHEPAVGLLLATADLLRAVADEKRPMPTRVKAAAVALADVILGDTDD